MKIKISITLFISILFINLKTIDAQCLDFVKTKGFKILDTEKYIPEGRFDAMMLSEGDNLSVYKSFFRGKTYRVVVIGAENLPSLKFQIKTMQGQVIYDNTADGNIDHWNYTSDRNQNLMVYIEIPSSYGTQPNTGCVAVILGYKTN